MTPEFINHIMGCKDCAPPHGRYCAEGREFKLKSDADFVLSLKSVDERRRTMESYKKNNPAMYVELCDLVRAMFEERKAHKAA